MSGFPNKPTREQFGPNMENARPPVIPEKDLSAAQVNLAFWQAAGSGRTCAAALVLIDGATPDILLQNMTFDPNQTLPDLALVKNGTGDYTITFAATYQDQNGQDVSFVPKAAMAHIQESLLNATEQVEVSGQDVNVKTYNNVPNPIDTTVLLLVWG